MTRTVTALARGTEVLELFLNGKSAWSQPEIASALRLPRSTVHEIVSTLAMRGYLAKLDERRVGLGPRVFELGNAYAESFDLVRRGSEVLADIAAATHETCHLAVLDGTDVLYVAKVDSTHAVRMVSAVGRRVPAHCTALGKVLLSALPEADVLARYGESELARLTPVSIGSMRALLVELDRVRRSGYATDDCESNPDVRCVALPVTDYWGQVVAAVSVSIPVHRAGLWPDGFLPPLVEATKRLSGLLGAQSPRR
jgi:DNA-binding IclR family transcriptional regulator